MLSDLGAVGAGGWQWRVTQGQKDVGLQRSFVFGFFLILFLFFRDLLDALKSEYGVINEKHEVIRIIYHFL